MQAECRIILRQWFTSCEDANGLALDKSRKSIIAITEILFIIIKTNLIKTDLIDETLKFTSTNIFLTINLAIKSSQYYQARTS